MRTFIILAVTTMLTILLIGCSTPHEDQLREYTIAKRIAADALTIDEKKTMLPWQREIVTLIPIQRVPSYIETKDLSTDAKIYKVEIYTSKDEIIGPIGMYIDIVRETVIGRHLRN